MKNELKQTAYSSYRCEYHIVFAPKYRRKIIYKELRKDIGEIFRKLCSKATDMGSVRFSENEAQGIK